MALNGVASRDCRKKSWLSAWTVCTNGFGRLSEPSKFFTFILVECARECSKPRLNEDVFGVSRVGTTRYRSTSAGYCEGPGESLEESWEWSA